MSPDADHAREQGLLAGTVIVGLGGLGPSARALRILADYGATVWLVDRVAPEGSGSWEVPFHAYAGARGWRRAEMDLRHTGARDAFLEVCSSVDVVLDGLRPGAADRLGVGASAACERNPGLIWCSASGYGTAGPYAGWAGHDINYSGLSGFTAVGQRRADGAPPLTGTSVADAAGGGMHAVVAVLAALVARASTGRGAVLDCSATDGMVALMALVLDERMATPVGPAHPGGGLLLGKFACYDHYETSDGRWLAVGAIEARFFVNLCAALDLDELVVDQYVPDAQDRLRAELRSRFLERPRDAWVTALGPLDACVTPVLEPEEVFADPHLASRGLTVEAEHPRYGRNRQVGPALAGTLPLDEPVRLPDRAVSETLALLASCGIDSTTAERLIEAGAIR